jgi:hypothetical protein
MIAPKNDTTGDLRTGCQPWLQDFHGRILLIKRGDCAFAEKIFWAERAGASALLIVSTDDHLFGMQISAKENYWSEYGNDVTNIPSAILLKRDGDRLLKFFTGLSEDSAILFKGLEDTTFRLHTGSFWIQNLIIEYESHHYISRNGRLYHGQSLKCELMCHADLKSCFQ